MKIGIAGAGAVGCIYGAKLAQAGHDVLFLARGDHLEAMKKSGLQMHTDEGSYVVSGKFTGDIKSFSEVDLILFTVKSHDTMEMAKNLQAIVKGDALIMTLQNGVDNEEKLVEFFGEKRVLSAATYVQGRIASPGVAELRGSTKMVIGSLHESIDAKAKELVDLFKKADMSVSYTDKIMEQKWQKFLWNITFNPLTALMKVRVGELLHNKHLYKVAEDVLLETLKVAQALDIDLDEQRMHQEVFGSNEGAEQHQTSMLQDRLRGRQMEVESLSGYIVRKGKELGIETPVNETLYHLLTAIN